MQYKFTGLILSLVTLILISACGTSKKLDAAQQQADALTAEKAALQKTVDDLQNELSAAKGQNASLNDQFSQYRQKCEADQEKCAAMQTVLADEAEELSQLEKTLETALADFNNQGVEVYENDGYIYVSMEDNLLYRSGSAKLDARGVDALGKVANVLNQYPKLKVVVVGNTDNVQFKKGTDNWTLSTERANGVVRLFRDKYNVDPVRLTSAGKGKYNPVADNSTPDGRAKNRRTDIILNPDLDRFLNHTKDGAQ